MLYQNKEYDTKRRVNKMAGQDNLFAGSKKEQIYIELRKKQSRYEKRRVAVAARRTRSSCYEECLRRNAVPRACYVYINGISMPVI